MSSRCWRTAIPSTIACCARRGSRSLSGSRSRRMPESSRDPYQLLGVERTASAEAIQQAYRKLAKKLHPDLNPGNKAAEEQFKDISVAYNLLNDPDKRAKFDRGE